MAISFKLENWNLKFKENFESPLANLSSKIALIIKAMDTNFTGFGEVATLGDIKEQQALLETKLVPHYLKTGEIIGTGPASAGLFCALKDLEAKQEGIPLWRLYGGSKRPIPVGVTIGFQKNLDSLLKRIEESLWAKRIKLKVSPETKPEVFDELFKAFPKAPISLDANQSFDEEPLYLDKYPFLMIEEPMKRLELNAKFQAKIGIPVCLDESIRSIDDCKEALRLKAGKIVSIKFSQVGSKAFEINRLCQDAGVGCWAGGMLESAVGRSHNLALATLDNFIYPSDVSTGMFVDDLFQIEHRDGFIVPSDELGIGGIPQTN